MSSASKLGQSWLLCRPVYRIKWCRWSPQHSSGIFVSLLFASLLVTGIVSFTNWRFVETLHPASLWGHFPKSIHSLMFLCHILVILAIFQTFSLLLYLLRWSMIKKKKTFIYLVVTGLNCCMQDLVPRPGIELWPLALGAQRLSK